MLVFRNEERDSIYSHNCFLPIIMLSCILLDFQSIKLLSLKTFLLKRFSIIIDMVVLHLNFNQVALFENFSS
jgi:hypothetical protein